MIEIFLIGIALCVKQFEMVNENKFSNDGSDKLIFEIYSYDETKNCTSNWKDCLEQKQIDLNKDETFKKYNSGKELEKSFQIIEEASLYDNKQATNGYANARKTLPSGEKAWGENISYDEFLFFDEYYFGSNMIIDYGGKTLSATGIATNLKFLTKSTADVPDFYDYLQASRGIKLVDTDVAPESEKLPEVKEKYKNFGQKLSFGVWNYGECSIGASDIKKLIALYGPVFVGFEVDKVSLDEYIKKKDKNAILTIPSGEVQVSTMLDLILFGWVEKKDKTPEYWIGKTLYQPKTGSKESDSDDYSGSIIKLEIGAGKVRHSTVDPGRLFVTLFNEKDYDPDTSFGIIPSLFVSAIFMVFSSLLL